MRIALAQFRAAANDPETNLHRGLDICREAAAVGADLLVFPEMWSTGYGARPREPKARAAWERGAIRPDSHWLESFRESAREHDMAVVATYVQAGPAGPANAATLIDRRGQDLLTHTKVHTCDFTWEEALVPGADFDVARLDTRAELYSTSMVSTPRPGTPMIASWRTVSPAKILSSRSTSAGIRTRDIQRLLRGRGRGVGGSNRGSWRGSGILGGMLRAPGNVSCWGSGSRQPGNGFCRGGEGCAKVGW